MQIATRLTHCVLCASGQLDEVVPLAPMPIATPNYRVPDGVPEAVFREAVPLGMHQCRACGHLQVMHVGNPELQYREYVYTTSISLGLPEHFRRYADAIVADLALPPGGLVVEIGSNDGTLLRAFAAAGMRVVGVDPARRIAEEATAAGIPTLAEFFSADVGRRVAAEHGPAALFVANNVFANVVELHDVAAGIAAVIDAGGVAVIETQYGADVIEHTLLDTVYHEHVSYFLLTPLLPFFAGHGLRVFDAERVPTKGGSIRVYVQRADAGRATTPRLRALLEREVALGMFSPPFYARLTDEIAAIGAELNALADRAHAHGRSVGGYGVSVGTTTLLAQFHLESKIDFLIDDAPREPFLRGPGYTIPTFGRDELLVRNPEIVIVFAWRYAEAIAQKNAAYQRGGGTFVVPLPRVAPVPLVRS